MCTSRFSDAFSSDHDVSLEEAEEIGHCIIPMFLQTTRTCFGHGTLNIRLSPRHPFATKQRTPRDHKTPTERIQGVGLGHDQLACRAFQRQLHHAVGQSDVNTHLSTHFSFNQNYTIQHKRFITSHSGPSSHDVLFLYSTQSSTTFILGLSPSHPSSLQKCRHIVSVDPHGSRDLERTTEALASSHAIKTSKLAANAV